MYLNQYLLLSSATNSTQLDWVSFILTLIEFFLGGHHLYTWTSDQKGLEHISTG